MKIEKLTIAVDLEMHLSEDEECIALDVGSSLNPKEKDEEKLVQEALEYWITLGLILNDDKELLKQEITEGDDTV